MSVVTLIIDAVLLLGIVATSLYGAVHLPAGARVPTHYGPGGYGNWQPKAFALVTYPLVGAGLFVALTVTARSQHRGDGLSIGLTVALAVILASLIGALRAALNNSGRE